MRDETDPLVEKLKKQITKIKRDRRMEDKYMKLEELMRDERREERANLFKLIRLMSENGQTSDIPRIEKDPAFFIEMLKKYGIENQI